MQLYLITYQTKRPETSSILGGDWIKEEKIIVGTENATSVINAVIKSLIDRIIVPDFRLKSIEEISKVDIIAPSLLK